MSNAPYCPVSRNGPLQNSKTAQPGHTDVNSIPAAHDLRTVINAINSMSNVVQHITRGAPQINNVYPPTVTGVPAPTQPSPTPVYGQMRWREAYRNYAEKKVVNPDDPDQEIPIKVLSSVEWVDSVTGHNLRYTGA